MGVSAEFRETSRRRRRRRRHRRRRLRVTRGSSFSGCHFGGGDGSQFKRGSRGDQQGTAVVLNGGRLRFASLSLCDVRAGRVLLQRGVRRLRRSFGHTGTHTVVQMREMGSMDWFVMREWEMGRCVKE